MILQFQNRSLVVADEVMQKTIELAERAARTLSPVLVCGESGTGKELIARLVHEKTSRLSGPFVSVNCAAIPEGLLEAELFGYERGAFTGAIARRIGKFEQANGGTLLLDEISEMPFSIQAKLLRALQEREIDRIGGSRPVSIQARVIATSNRDPLALAREGAFREDLYYRLNVIRIECKPLRGRRKAIVSLASRFLDDIAAREERGPMRFSGAALEKLCAHKWPGNIRELQNAVERAVVVFDGAEIPEDCLELRESLATGPASNLSDVEKEHILATLRNSAGNRTVAAKQLGITARTLRTKLKDYGV